MDGMIGHLFLREILSGCGTTPRRNGGLRRDRVSPPGFEAIDKGVPGVAKSAPVGSDGCKNDECDQSNEDDQRDSDDPTKHLNSTVAFRFLFLREFLAISGTAPRKNGLASRRRRSGRRIGRPFPSSRW